MKRNIAIIAGGDSSEHDVSLRSAAGLYSFMDKERYNITIVRLHGKEWVAYPHPLPEGKGVEEYFASSETCPIDKNDFSFTVGGVKQTLDFAYISSHGNPRDYGLFHGYL